MRIILRPLHPHVRAAQTSDSAPRASASPRLASSWRFSPLRATHTCNAVVSLHARRSQPDDPLPRRPPASGLSQHRHLFRHVLQPLPRPALSGASVRPSSHRHPVHSPSFLMLGSYSRCAARAVPLPLSPYLSLSLSPSPSLPFSPRIALLVLSVALRRSSRSFSLSLSPRPLPRALLKKKEEDLGQFLSHKPADRAAPIKNASLRMAIGPQRASGVMPNRSLSPAAPRGLPPAVGVSFLRASSGPLPVLLVRSLALLCLFRPFLLFFRRGEKMRAARRLVEGTDDVVSDVPPPGLGGGDARETVVRGCAVECERRHRRVHISRGCCTRGEEGNRKNLRSNWKYYYARRDFGISVREGRTSAHIGRRSSGRTRACFDRDHRSSFCRDRL